MSKHIILGAGLNSIIAALTLSKWESNEVILFSDGKPLGAHFFGLDIEGYSFDNGMIYMEPAINLNELSVNKSAPYNPDIRYDWTRFGQKLNDFIFENSSLVQLKTPISYINGNYFPDILISDCLDAIPHIYAEDDLKPKYSGELHPKNKKTSFIWQSLSYVEVAKLLHGKGLSEIIANTFLRKICPPDEVDKVLAKYHRMLWLPLYYPETIHLAAQRVKFNSIKEYKFYTPRSGFVGEFTRNLIAQLKDRNNVKIVTQKLSAINIKKNHIKVLLDESKEVHDYTGAIYSGLQADRFFAITDPYLFISKSLKCTGVHICYVLVSKKHIKNNFSTLNILDASDAPLRISNMDSFESCDDEFARVTIEYPLDFSHISGGNSPADEVIRGDIYKHIFLSDIAEKDAIKILKKLTLNKALVLPTIENLSVYQEVRDIMSKNFPDVKSFASVSHYGVASMNDQIIQGLSVEDQFYD